MKNNKKTTGKKMHLKNGCKSPLKEIGFSRLLEIKVMYFAKPQSVILRCAVGDLLDWRSKAFCTSSRDIDKAI